MSRVCLYFHSMRYTWVYVFGCDRYRCIGVGFCVARSTSMGNARASKGVNEQQIQILTLFLFYSHTRKHTSVRGIYGGKHTIMKKERNEELQSRREFFKNAAKGVLPILGAIALANIPLVANATNTNSTGCTTCYGACYGCTGSCAGKCLDACTSCSGLCQGTCKGMCYNSGK